MKDPKLVIATFDSAILGPDTISLTSHGEFFAVLNGKRLTAHSLLSIKNKLEKATREVFVPFMAFGMDGLKIKPFRVVGITRQKARYLFNVEREDPIFAWRTSVRIDTPANRKAAMTHSKHALRRQKIENKLYRESQQLKNKIVVVNAAEMAKTKAATKKKAK